MRRIEEKDRLKGGVDAKDVDKYLNRFQPKEVSKGIAVEKEHTTCPALAKEIASDHLGEDPHYYSKLAKIHKESVDVFEFNFHDILEIIWDDPEDRPLAAVAAPEKPKAVTPSPAKPHTKSDKPERSGMAGLLHAVLKSPDTPAPANQSTYAHRKERAAAAKLARDDNFAKRKDTLKADMVKSGRPEHEITASLASMEPPSKRGRPATGPVSDTHHTKPRELKLHPGPDSLADKGKEKDKSYKDYRKWEPSPALQTAMAAIGKPWKKREPQPFVFMLPKK